MEQNIYQYTDRDRTEKFTVCKPDGYGGFTSYGEGINKSPTAEIHGLAFGGYEKLSTARAAAVRMFGYSKATATR